MSKNAILWRRDSEKDPDNFVIPRMTTPEIRYKINDLGVYSDKTKWYNKTKKE